MDNVDCYFIWLAHHFGEGLFEVRRILEGMGGTFPTPPSSSEGSGGGAPGPKGPKGFPKN